MSEIAELKINLETCLESKMPAHLDAKQIRVLLDELARLEKENAQLVKILIDVNKEIKDSWDARILPAEAISAEICQRIKRAIEGKLNERKI
jgi:uncharacterized protein (UPF0335 family)